MATSLILTPQGTAVSLFSTDLNSLAANTPVVSSVGGSSGVFNNQAGGTSNLVGYAYGRINFTIAALASACTTSTIGMWFLQSSDAGSTYEDGSSSTVPSRPPDVVFFPKATASAQVLAGVSNVGDPENHGSTKIRLPAGHFKCLLYWSGGNVALASSGSSVKVIAFTENQN